MDRNKQFEIGPSLAIVIVLSALVIAGLYLYGQLTKQSIREARNTTQISVETINQIRAQQERDAQTAELEALSSATDTAIIAEELEADLEAGFDTQDLDQLDLELLEFEDLDDIDFSLEATTTAQ